MPVVTIGTAVNMSLLKMKWREQYVSEGLNRKIIPDSPAGIYRGLRLEFDATQGLTDRRVAIGTGSDSTHEAVYQNTTGHSLTYQDNSGTTIILDLGAVDLNNEETVIALFVDYQIGADTTAEWRAYPVGDFNALPAAEKDELLVLGTVDVPAADTNVTASMIRLERRRYAWENRAPGGSEWEPLLAGTSFEVGAVGTTRYDIAHWVTEETGGSGTWDLQGDARTGEGGLRMMNISGASWVGELRRYLGRHVKVDQVIRYRIFKRTQAVSAGGTLSLRFVFEDAALTTGSGTSHDIPIPTGVVDAGFVEVGGLFSLDEVGISSNSVLRYIALRSDGMDGASTVDFDGVQVWLERGEAADPGRGTGETVGAPGYFNPLFLTSEGSVFGTDGAAILDFNDSLNEVDILNPQNVDQAGNVGSTNESPNLRLRGVISSIGEDKLGSATELNTARVTVPISNTVDEFTLLFETGGGDTGQKSRIYTRHTGGYMITFNAKYDNLALQWTADSVAEAAHKLRALDGGLEMFRKQDTSVAWADSAWDPNEPFDFGRSPLLTLRSSNFDGNNGKGLVVNEDASYTGTTNNLVEIKKNTDGGTGGAALLIEKMPPTATGSSGYALEIETNANQYDEAVLINHWGTASSLLINHAATGSSQGINLDHHGNSSGHAISVWKNGGSGDSINIDDNGTGEALYIDNSNSNNALEIVNSTSSSALLINQNGTGAGADINAVNGTCLTVDSNGSGTALNIDNATGGHAIDLDDTSATSTNCVDIRKTSATGGDLLQVLGPTVDHQANMSFVYYGRLRVDGNDDNTGSSFQTASSRSSLAGDLVQHTSDRTSSTAFNLMRLFAGGGGDPKFRVRGDGQIYADNGTIGTPADYAEWVNVVQNKVNYAPGDVMVFSGGEELFDVSTSPSSAMIAGVYSTNPLVLGNHSPGCDEHNCDMTSGTLEVAAWETLTLEGDPDSTNWNRISIDGNRVIDYPVDSAVRFDSTTSCMVEAVVYDSQTNKTIVTVDQHYPRPFSSTSGMELYYGMTGRNVIPMAMLGQVPVKCITENGTISPGDMLVTSSTTGHAMKVGGSPALGTILGKAMETLTDTGGGADTGLIMAYVNLH